MITRLMIFFVLLSTNTLPSQQAEPISSVLATVEPIRASMHLPDGSRATYTYHFDHNALTDGVLAGRSLMAITDSGNLLEFNADNLALTGHTIAPGRAVSITAESTDSALIGTQDGRIYRAHVGSLQLDTVTFASGNVVWLTYDTAAGHPGGRIVFAVDRTPVVRPWPGESDEAFNNRKRAAGLRVANTYAVEVFERGRLRELPFPKLRLFTIPGHYLIDSQDHLWMGANNGEWGGKCYRMDLRTGAVETLKGGIEGVLGFLRAPSGHTIVYGGVSHLGMHEGYVSEAKAGRLNIIAEFEHDDSGPPQDDAHLPEAVAKAVREAAARKKEEDKDKPNAEIDLVAIDSHGGYWVVSEHVLFHADDEFKVWRRIVDLGGRWISGRRFSVGGTPTINRLIEAPDGSNALIAVMGKDGLERISNGKIERRSFSGQLESDVLDIWKTASGVVFVDTDLEDRMLWRLEGDQWHMRSPFPNDPPADDGTQWGFAEPFGNDGSRIRAFAHDNIGPGESFLVELNEGDAAAVVDSWPGDMSEFDTAFLVSSDGVVLKTTDKKLFKRTRKMWETVGDSEYSSDPDRMLTLNGREFELIGTANGKDVFWETGYGDLFQLGKRGTDNDGYQLSRAQFAGRPAPSAILDAMPEPANRVLLSTAQGIFELDLETGHSSPIPSPHAGEIIASVCRDSQNGLWAAGDSLYLSFDDGRHWAAIKLSMLMHTLPKRIRVNPENPFQIVLMLEERGLVTIELQ